MYRPINILRPDFERKNMKLCGLWLLALLSLPSSPVSLFRFSLIPPSLLPFPFALATQARVLEKSCFLPRYLSWEILLFSLTYPWKLSTVNLPREMAVTHGLVFYYGKRLCTAVNRPLCDHNLFTGVILN